MRFLVPTAALAVALVACSGKSADDKAAAAPATTPAQKTVFDTQLKALQKAKDVQKTVDQQKADMDKKLEDSGG
jgi:hypothetical protein